MRQSLRYASWLLLLFILLSCSHRVTGEATALPPILQAEAQSQKYNLQLDFMKHHSAECSLSAKCLITKSVSWDPLTLASAF